MIGGPRLFWLQRSAVFSRPSDIGRRTTRRLMEEEEAAVPSEKRCANQYSGERVNWGSPRSL